MKKLLPPLALLLLLTRATFAEDIAITKVLAVGPVTRGGRTLVHRDPIEAQIVRGDWHAPKAGDPVPASTSTWSELQADKDGSFRGRAFGGGYAYAAVPSDRDRIMILEAAGHTLVYVNGVPRTGDPYGYGYVRIPIELKHGTNDLLFSVGRGQLHARLIDPTTPVMLDASDSTLPDLRIGEKTRTWGAAVVINAAAKPLTNGAIEATVEGGKTTRTPIPAMLPLGVRKVGFRLEGSAQPALSAANGSEPKDAEVELRLVGITPAPAPIKFKLRIRKPEWSYQRTFVSAIDGSVQYYAVNPASRSTMDDGRRTPATSIKNQKSKNQNSAERPALVLTLHGASVEGLGQADAYAAKSWAHLVAPTNRRPYGFDWEEWGRLDAMEVLDLAQKELGTDPRRTYLTGHSMGGHGTWQIGGNYPDRFAAIAPSAGWISFASYAGGQRIENPDPIEAMLQRSSNPSDTMALSGNYSSEGVYILHGSADDNVPVTEARTMAARLKTFHHDWDFHEQPGAGHWWSVGDEPGAQCVDWPGIFDLFARRRLPEIGEVRDVQFSTANPEITSRCYWATIEAQWSPLQISTVKLRYDPIMRRYSGTTDNVSRLGIDLSHMTPGPINLEIDGTRLNAVEWPVGARLTLERSPIAWYVVLHAPKAFKGPLRYGTFKAAFNHNFIFVYGTTGTPGENAWSLGKARYDAETFGYRGNGSVDVVPDRDLNLTKTRGRSVIVYGNADTNAAWKLLLGNDVVVRRGSVRIGEREMKGDDLACLFVRPRADSDSACVGVVSGTGLTGMRLCDRVPIFLSGVGIPDLIVMSPKSLLDGAKGILAAGYFNVDWSVGSDFAFR